MIEVPTSGHVYIEEIRQLVTWLNAKLVIPVHTFKPERFTSFHSAVRLPRDGETVIV